MTAPQCACKSVWCPHCGRGRAATRDDYWDRTRHNPNLRRDALYVAQQTGAGAGAWFWGLLIGAAVVFWPSYALHGETRTAVSVAWYGLIGLGAIVFLVAVTVGQARRQPRRVPPPAPPVRNASPGPLPVPALPICLHRNAVKVNSGVPGLDLIYRCWCPACETALPATFRYPCCGGEPGVLPGTGHVYNCRQAAR